MKKVILKTIVVAAVCCATAVYAKQDMSVPRPGVAAETGSMGSSAVFKEVPAPGKSVAVKSLVQPAVKVAQRVENADDNVVFYDNFDDGDYVRSNYTIVDVDGDGHSNHNIWYWKEDETLMQYNSDKIREANDWLITPAIHLDGRNEYTFSYTVNMGDPVNFRVTIGSSADPDDQTTVLATHTEFYAWKQQTMDVDFTVPAEGDYYIGFYVYSGLEASWMNLFDVKVTRGIYLFAPQAVTALTVTPGANGAEEAEIAFDMPTQLVNGDALEGQVTANIYRDDNLVHSLQAAPGTHCSWTDTETGSGLFTYKVACANAEGEEGAAESVTVTVGSDLAEPVGNMQARVINGCKGAELTWTAPTKGANGGYFDPATVTYNIWRCTDDQNYELIAENVKETMYTDADISDALAATGLPQETFYYGVTAVNGRGESEMATDVKVLGTPYTLPVGESFPNGQFDIYRWTVTSVVGSLGWICLNQGEGGIEPQDGDSGFIKFYSSWWADTEVDSQLFSPWFSLKDTENPVFSFYMYHWDESSIDPSGRNTKLVIEISTDDETYVQIGEDFMATSATYGWQEHRISLAGYEGCEHVRIALRGVMDNNWMYYYVDNINIEELAACDLASSSFSGATSLPMNSRGAYYFTYHNRGTEAVDDYSLTLYIDGLPVQSIDGEAIEAGDERTVEFTVDATAARAGQSHEIYAEIDCPGDGNLTNNRSVSLLLDVDGTWYPQASGLTGNAGETEVSLKWDAPVLPDEVTETEDGAEDYEPFAISGIGDWTMIDGDERSSGRYTAVPSDPNVGVNQSFMVWNPYELEPDTVDWSSPSVSFLLPRTGNQCFLCWYAVTGIFDGETYSAPYNDDWMVSPELLPGSTFSFYVRKLRISYTGETYEVLYSKTTPTDTTAFEVLRKAEAAIDWERVEVTVPDDARYIAIRYTASDCLGIMVDDITYTSALYGLKIAGYNVFRNGEKINDVLLTEPSYTDYDVRPGTDYEYAVSVVYNLGESVATEPLEIRTAGSGVDDVTNTGVIVLAEQGHVIVRSPEGADVSVWGLDGKQAGSKIIGEDGGTVSIPVAPGLCLVRVVTAAGVETVKVVVR